ncbi:MAG: C4-type zinc ribbon domain-containing protein [Acidobacteriota bacterium]|nr:C4-type zinc ribbon domain-containing protein [Acidobacteriota bacterium]
MTADIEQVTRLQSLDLKIADLQREVAALPKHVSQIEKTLESHLRRLEADRAALAGNQKERKRLEDDIKVHEQKVSKLKDQMLLAKNNEQYKAFQHEIDFAANAIRKCEDGILDLMTESEPLEANVKKAELSLKEEKRQVDAEKVLANERTAVDQKQLDQLQTDRKQVAAKVQPQTYAAYERIKKKWRGLALAEAQDGRCSACQISLRPQFYQELRRGEELMFCESCGRILYYNPPVSFENDIAQPAQAAKT